jgi:hypothetical protein
MRSKITLIPVAVLVVALVGCGADTRSKEPVFDTAAEFSRVTTARAELTTAREEVDRIENELAALESQRRLSPEEQTRRDQLQAELKASQARIDEAFSEDQAALSGFLNETLNDPTLRQAPETQKALDLYAQETIRNANEFIERSGDYRKAIDILENAKQYFEFAELPPSPELEAAVAEARSMRYPTRERFAQLKRGMTEGDVRQIAGVPLQPYNVRETEQGGRQIVTWMYPRDDGGVAAVYFEKGRVYNINFDAKKPS